MDLQEVNENDLELLEKFDQDYKKYNPNLNGWVSSQKLPILINQWIEERNDNSKVHFYPFWFILDNTPIGLIILKDNIEVDEVWRDYGGNISYAIAPSHRKMGYGTIGLHLALEKCKELGIENALVTCFDENVASAKIIEKNYGVLKDKIMDSYAKKGETKLSRRYIINVDESLKRYDEEKNKTR